MTATSTQSMTPVSRMNRPALEQDLMTRFNRLTASKSKKLNGGDVNKFSTKMAALRACSWKNFRAQYDELNDWLTNIERQT